MKIVLDTNIIFSAVLNTNGNIGELLFNSNKIFEFYSCSQMRFEISKHREKLKKIAKLSDEELDVSLALVFSRIHFINEELIPDETWLKAEKLVQDVDENDIDFVALTIFLKAKLWTGDKILYNGLKDRNFNKIYTTAEMIAARK